jgi:hypothetical protein
MVGEEPGLATVLVPETLWDFPVKVYPLMKTKLASHPGKEKGETPVEKMTANTEKTASSLEACMESVLEAPLYSTAFVGKKV